MTQLPPPGTTPINYGRPDAPRQANTLAIVSLVCGIIGCFVVTPIVAIITGVLALGKARLHGGRGLAITGIVLGVLWCVGLLGLGIGGFALYKNAAALMANVAKPQTIAVINRVQGGDTSRDAATFALTDADMADIAAVAGPLGKCHDITILGSGGASINNTNGVVTVDFSGTATFDKGTSPVRARMRLEQPAGSSQTTMVFQELKLR